MIRAFFRSWAGYVALALHLAKAVPGEGARSSPKRIAIFLLGWIAFGLLNALHWLGFALDEILFRGYRRVDVERPIEIVGVPRSGTTFLQRALATEPKFTTLTLLECILAPSISERWLWLGLGRVLARVLPRLRLSRMEAIHPIGLGEPEEDFLLLLWVHACFLAVVPCPDEERYWRLARFDRIVPESEREMVFDFYYRCLQKHLYYHGTDKRLLSKNPSFTPMLASLRRRLPDAVVVACVRPPVETVPSQLSSLVPAFEFVGSGRLGGRFRQRMIDALRDYYGDLQRFAETDEPCVVEMSRLNRELEIVVGEIFDFAGHQPSPEFRSKLVDLGADSRAYESAHKYSLDAFELSEAEIQRSFSAVWPLSLMSA